MKFCRRTILYHHTLILSQQLHIISIIITCLLTLLIGTLRYLLPINMVMLILCCI